MSGYTDEDYEQSLDEDLGWRRTELNYLKDQLASANSSSPQSPATRALGRALTVMCYAHWEGYSKNALERYARLVAKRRPALSQAGPGLALNHVQHLTRRIASGDSSAEQELLAITGKAHDPRLHVDRDALSDSKSNLRFAVLKSLLTTGCIPVEPFTLKAKLIDVRLCDRRNDIAHGRNLLTPADEGIELCDETVQLLETMRSIMVSQVSCKRYLTHSEVG